MKNLKTIGLLSLMLVLIASCQKKGDFITDKLFYKQGEVITVTNTTKKASTYYKWTFGSEEVVAENPIYTIPENTPVGTFTISVLPVNSLSTTENTKRNTKTVTIEEAEEGKLIFFLPSPVFSSFDETCTVTINDVTKTAEVNSTIPNCDSNNNLSAATFDNLASGTYDYQILGSSSSGTYSYFGSFEIEDGFDCRLIDITSL